jgi:cytochrome c-type protein NapB
MKAKHIIIVAAAAWLIAGVGCSDEPDQAVVESPTTWEERASRRAFAGAPPVIPHPPLTGTCAECHTPTGGKVIPEVGIAPANPHTQTAGMSEQSRCKQCHVFQSSDELFVENVFVGLTIEEHFGARAHEQAPPTVPHPLFMREDCAACHTGPAARPEIVCDHADRVRCRQCHVEGNGAVEDLFANEVALE